MKTFYLEQRGIALKVLKIKKTHLLGICLLAASFCGLSPKANAIDLTQSYYKAIGYNPSYLSSTYQYKASQTYKMQGLSYLLPQISLSANRSKYDFRTAPYYYANYMANTISLNAQQYLFNLSSFAMFKELNTKAKMGEYQFKDADQQTIYNVAQSYFDVLSALDQINLTKMEKKAAHEDLVLAQKLYKAGEATLVDVDDAQSRYDITSAKLIQAQNKLDIALTKFKAIVGIMPRSISPLKDDISFKFPTPSKLDDWIELAKQNSPVIKYYEQNVNYYKQDLTKAIGDQLPSVALIASYTYTNTNSYIQTETIKYASIGIQINVPIFNGGNSIARIDEAHYRVKQAQMDKENYQNNITSSVTEAFLNVSSDISKIDSLRIAKKAAQTALKANYMGLKAGIKTIADVINAQKQLYDVENQLLNAKYSYITDMFKLKYYSGVLSKDDIDFFNTYLAPSSELIVSNN
ncbi:MAG: TolC family outer membrane protein [Desulfurella sp.]|uniref:TolC family outer membrane protein n=1 Tax=Desulfurella sp. TaxID=1962857 RepID=UPI003D0A153F